jgi:hypothetical protein
MSDQNDAEPKTLDENDIPVDWGELPDPFKDSEQASETPAEMQVFAGIVGAEIETRLVAHLGGIKKDINEILSLVQRVVTLETKVEKQGREIADLKAWQKLVNDMLGIEAAE